MTSEEVTGTQDSLETLQFYWLALRAMVVVAETLSTCGIQLLKAEGSYRSATNGELAAKSNLAINFMPLTT